MQNSKKTRYIVKAKFNRWYMPTASWPRFTEKSAQQTLDQIKKNAKQNRFVEGAVYRVTPAGLVKVS
jgi:hypothetical protein